MNEEDRLVKNIILNTALHQYKLKLKRELKKDTNNDKINKILKHINELEEIEE